MLVIFRIAQNTAVFNKAVAFDHTDGKVHILLKLSSERCVIIRERQEKGLGKT